MRKPYQILFLCVLVLAIYFPTLTAEVSLVDDQEMLSSMFNSDPISLKAVFMPQTDNGGYYRPLVGLSYYLDRALWDLDVRSMHLDNIVMHLINVLIVYFVAVIARRPPDSSVFIPFVAATVFAMHPLATESVNWISGRTDPIAGNFIFAATYMLLLYRLNSMKKYLAFALVLIFMGVLAKEVSFGMILGAWFISKAEEDRDLGIHCDLDSGKNMKSPFHLYGVPFFLLVYGVMVVEMLFVGNYWFVLVVCVAYYIVLKFWMGEERCLLVFKLKNLLMFAGCICLSGALYGVLRRLAFKSDAGKISQTVMLMMSDLNYSISLFLGASGFYFKKFVIPVPLNFYILEVDPLYDLVGILLLLFCVRLLVRLTLAGAFFITGFCMLFPAFPFAFGTIAWTGYAERYVYISSAFWLISATIYLNEKYNKKYIKEICLAVSLLIICFFGYQTYSRNIIWQKNLTLLEDTVSKSPKARRLRDMYMYALYQAGEKDAAIKQYKIAQSLYSIRYDESADLLMARILADEGKLEEALTLYEGTVKKTRNTSVNAIKHLTSHLEIMINGANSVARRICLTNKLKEYYLILGEISSDPMILYNLGQKSLAFNEQKMALAYFVRANSAFPMHSPYKMNTAKLIGRLRQDLEWNK